MIPWIYRALRSVPCFGLVGACKLFVASQTRRVVWIQPRGYGRPVMVRGGTSDPVVAYLVFCGADYPVVQLDSVEWVIDAGANAGYFSVFAARHYPKAKILAIEPEASNFETLKANAEGEPRIIPIQAGLWSEPGTLWIENPGAEKWCFKCEAATDGVAGKGSPLQAVTVRGLMAEHAFPHVDVFKIDIEGGEKEVFSAADTTWLAQIRVLMIELHPKCWQSFFKAIEPYPYDIRQAGENLVVLLGKLANRSGLLKKGGA